MKTTNSLPPPKPTKDSRKPSPSQPESPFSRKPWAVPYWSYQDDITKGKTQDLTPFLIGLDLALRLGPWNLVINHFIGFCVVAWLLIRDWRKERSVYFAYGLALAFFTLLLVSDPILLHNTGWYQFCLWYGGRPA